MNVNALQAGQVFAFPLNWDAYWGACRIVRIDKGAAVLATLEWIGTARPTLEQVSDCPLVYDNHGPFEGDPAIFWGAQTPPPDFEYVGLSAPSHTELALTTCHCQGRVCLCKRRQGGWKACRANLVRYWQWKIDREGYETARAVVRQELERVNAQQSSQPEPLTLADFRRTTLFAGWEGYREKSLIEASRRIFGATVDKLAGLEPGQVDARLNVMQACIEQFNDLDSEHAFIETIEREEICEAFAQLARIVGLEEDLADRWREW